jgi:hypothetical protein
MLRPERANSMRHASVRFQKAPDVVVARRGDEVILLDLDREVNFSAAGVGRAIRHLLATPTTFSVVVDRLAAAYDASPDRIAADVEAFLAALLRERLATSS